MISVCIATYNGEKFIEEQIKSILIQLEENDEIIISDDSSTDDTIKIIENIADSRIKLLKYNKFHSPVKNFENALLHANGDYIFLADQDDVWLHGRITEGLEVLKSGLVDCVTCNRIIINQEGIGNSIPVEKEDFTKSALWKIIMHNKYIGCCMCFNRNLLEMALPFPNNLPMHDLWIGLLAHWQHRSGYISKPLIAYRRHANNVTTGESPYSIWFRIKYRVKLLYNLYKRLHNKQL